MRHIFELKWLMATLEVGDTVWWSDPDNGFSSGYYKVIEIKTEDGKLHYEDEIVLISNGTSQAEVFPNELSFYRPFSIILV